MTIDRGTAALVASMRRGAPRPPVTLASLPAGLERAREAQRVVALAAAARPAGALTGVGGILPEFTGPEAARARIAAVDGFLSGLEADMRRDAIGRGGPLGDLGARWEVFFARWVVFRDANKGPEWSAWQTLSAASIANQADQYEEDGKKYRDELIKLGGHPSVIAPAEKPIDPNLAAVTSTAKYAAIAIVAVALAVVVAKARG